MKWRYAGYDNETGYSDEGFWEWWSVVDQDDDPVADVKTSVDDAHLIAAAPDLLDALMEIDQWSRRANVALPSPAIYAAISKARGQGQ